MKLLSKLPLFTLTLFFGMMSSFAPAIAQEYEEDMSKYSLTDIQRSDSLFYDAMKAKVQNDPKRVQDALLAFTEQRPKNATGWYELSRIYLNDKKIQAAETTIKKAISLDGDNKWYRSQYATVLEYNNEPREAADLLMKMAKAEKFNLEYLYRATALYKRAKRYQDAQEALNMLIEQDGEDEAYLMEKGDIYTIEKDWDNAAKIMERLIEINPMEGRYYVDLANIYELAKDTYKSEEVYRRAQNMLPDDPFLQKALAIKSISNSDSTGFSKNMKKLVLNKSLSVEEQVNMLDNYVNLPYNDANKWAEALEIADELAKQHPDNALVAFVRGRILRYNSQPDKAVAEFKRSLSIDQSSLGVWEELFSSAVEKNQADSLNAYTDRALRIFPNNAIMHYYKGIALMNKDDNAGAIKTFNRAIDMFPDDNTLGLSRVYSILGDIYHNMKEHKLSDENYRKAIKLEPDNPFSLNNFAYYLSERGESLDEAEQMSRRSLERAPNEATFLDTYGWILYKQGKYSKAKEYIQKALISRPDQSDGTVYDHLGDVLYKLNDKEGALQNWQKAKEKGTDNPNLDKKIQEQKLYE